MSQASDDRICRTCKVFVPEGQPFYRYRDGAGLCVDCEKKSAIPQEFPGWPHAGIAYFVAFLVIIAGLCVVGALSQAATNGPFAVLCLVGAVLWLALAMGIHLLRRILITIEGSSGGSPPSPQ